MKMPLYNKLDCYIVVVGLILMHLFVLGLCIFWIDRFIIKAFNPGVIVLLIMFVGGAVLCDVLLYRIQGFSRFLIRCKVDDIGILCYRFASKHWRIAWKDICLYGTTGYELSNSYGIVYLSTVIFNINNENCVRISSSQISFSTNSAIWNEIQKYLPEEMCYNLQRSVLAKENRFWKKKKTD